MGQRRRAYVMVDDWRGMAKRLLNCGTFELFLGSAGAHDLQSAASLQASLQPVCSQSAKTDHAPRGIRGFLNKGNYNCT